MNIFRNKREIVLILLIIIAFSFSFQFVFAEENHTSDVNQNSTVDLLKVSDDNLSKKISIDDSYDNISNSPETTLFIVSDNPGVNILDKASLELFEEGKLKDVNLIVRNGNQIKEMDENELINYLSSCDAFIARSLSTV